MQLWVSKENGEIHLVHDSTDWQVPEANGVDLKESEKIYTI